jgi:hypothetical protein
MNEDLVELAEQNGGAIVLYTVIQWVSCSNLMNLGQITDE